jgi:hypothetical protein
MAQSEHFAFIDSRLFARLHFGSLEPLVVVLKNGQKLVGEAKGIARGAVPGSGEPPQSRGTILLATGEGDIEVDYMTIVDIT